MTRTPEPEEQAARFVAEWLQKNPIPLPPLDEEQFAAAMNATARGMLHAYTAGYALGTAREMTPTRARASTKKPPKPQ